MRKRTIIIVIILFLVAIEVSSQLIQAKNDVTHQHEIYNSENPELTGFDENGDLATHLPVIIFENNGKVIPGADRKSEETLTCDFAVIDNVSSINKTSDSPTSKGHVSINIRGNSSRYLEKKQYAVKSVNESNMPLDIELLGLPKGSTWALNGSYIDYAQIRNYMLYNISGEIMGYAPRCRLCEVFLTDKDGKLEYQGLYTLIEKVSVRKERLHLTKYDKKFTETSFILQMNRRIENYKIEHLNPDALNPYSLDLEYPDIDELTEKSLKYIRSEVLIFEKSLNDALITGDWREVLRQIDIDSFVDYYIINEFFQNYDAGIRSTYIFRDLGGKISMGPVWDFDGAFDNYTGVNMKPNMLGLKDSFYFSYLTLCPEFSERCNVRYKELRTKFLSDEYLIEYIDDAGEYLGTSLMRNCDKWYDGNYDIYKNDLEKMKNFVLERGKWMDENFGKYAAVGE